MTRTTDDLNPETFKPFGEKVPKPVPAPPRIPAQAPRGPYGVVQDADGRLRTTKGP